MLRFTSVLVVCFVVSWLPSRAIAEDNDGDGYPASIDCDDDDPDIRPGADEICDDGIDQDCRFGDLIGDADGDGYIGLHCGGAADDCDDEDIQVHPGANERCNGTDDDCNGVLPPDEIDGDEDGASSCQGDCDDEDPTIAFGGAEQLDDCLDGIDNDCDGDLDDDDSDCFLPPQLRLEGRIEVDYLGGVGTAVLDASGSTDPNPTDVLTFHWELLDEGAELTPDGAYATLRFLPGEDDPGPWAFWVEMSVDDGVWIVGPTQTVVAFYRPEAAEGVDGCTVAESGSPSSWAIGLPLLGAFALRRRRTKD